MRCSFIIARDLRSAGTIKKERGNPNDSARFIGKVAVTEDGETAKIYNYLDTEKIEQEGFAVWDEGRRAQMRFVRKMCKGVQNGC